MDRTAGSHTSRVDWYTEDWMSMEYESDHTQEEWIALTAERNEQIEEEEQRWKQQGFHPGMIQINQYILQFKMNMLVTFLTDVLGVSTDELEARFKQEVLEQLKRDRAMLIEEKQKAAKPGMVLPNKKLLGPNGEVIL